MGEAGFSYSVHQTQSPVFDPHLEHHFAPPEGEEQGEEEDEEHFYEGGSSSDAGLHAAHFSDTEPTAASSSHEGSQQGLKLDERSGRWWQRLVRLPTLPTLYRNILKCSLAYFLGSLFTYYLPLSRFISKLTQDGPGEKYPSATGHMVATV